MPDYQTQAPALIIEYRDPLEGFPGWLVIDDLSHSLCAGGIRVQKGLTREHMARMARNMTLKMRICGLPIDGAKCGIAYDPDSPGKIEALRRFMKAIRPYILTRYSMGPDLNTRMPELEAIARSLGIPSIKMAIASAQGFNLDYFMERYGILRANDEALGDWHLGAIRAGYGVAAAALNLLDLLHIKRSGAVAAVQGFGNLAKAALSTLLDNKVNITAVADAEKAIFPAEGTQLHLAPLQPNGPLLIGPEHILGQKTLSKPTQSILETPCDILVLAAIENTVTEHNAHLIKAKAIVPGANLAVSEAAEQILHDRGICVLPSFVAGCGGSLSMNGLFGPQEHPKPTDVLTYINCAMKEMVNMIVARSEKEQITPAAAALLYCNEQALKPDCKPYSQTYHCCNLGQCEI